MNFVGDGLLLLNRKVDGCGLSWHLRPGGHGNYEPYILSSQHVMLGGGKWSRR
jgi:hypothetical protein